MQSNGPSSVCGKYDNFPCFMLTYSLIRHSKRHTTTTHKFSVNQTVEVDVLSGRCVVQSASEQITNSGETNSLFLVPWL